MRRAAWLGCALTLALTLSACSSPPDLEVDRARTLEADVLVVTRAAAAAKWDAVAAGIAAARSDLDAGLDAGDLSTARYREIDAALDRVAAEAEAAQDRAAAAAKATSAAATAKEATATPTIAAPTPAAKISATPPGSTKGKGSDKGKGQKHAPHPKKNK